MIRSVDIEKKRLKLIVLIFMLLFNASTLQITSKVEFDKLEAEELLKESYKPLVDLVKVLTPTEDEGLLLVPTYIRTEKDFINLFNKKMEVSMLERFYEDLVIEKNERLYINSLVYIPTVYDENSKVTEAYIRKKRSIFSIILDKKDDEDEKLIIKETWMITGTWSKRSNYYIKNEHGEWVLDYFNGTRQYTFEHPINNPWNM